jgi:ribosomal protein S18 acetylase RimI-like enzyme
MDLTLRTEYWDDPTAKAAFNDFLVEIHGLALSNWDSQGYWDKAFTPFSFFEGDKIISNVCIYSLDAVVNGKPTRLAQISSVGTSPDWRRKGLNRQLTNIGLEWAGGNHDGVFLFSDTGAISFYEACGFRPIEEYVEFVEAGTVDRIDGIVKLDPENRQDLDRIYEVAKRRTPVSNRFSILNAKLVMFHVLYYLRVHLFEIPDLDCVVFFKREEGILKIFDILAERIPSWSELHPYLADEGDRIVEFHFHADKLGINEIKTKPLSGNNPFVKDIFPIERPVFPYTSRA